MPIHLTVDNIGANNGVAGLDANGLIITTQLSEHFIPSISSDELADQSPVSLDTPVMIKFGPAIGSDAYIDLAANGEITSKEAGKYFLRGRFGIGRISNPGIARLYLRAVYTPFGGPAVNGTPIHFVLPDSASSETFEFITVFDFPVDDTFSLEMYRDSSGSNDGGLFSYTPGLSGWGVTPSASVSIWKII